MRLALFLSLVLTACGPKDKPIESLVDGTAGDAVSADAGDATDVSAGEATDATAAGDFDTSAVPVQERLADAVDLLASDAEGESGRALAILEQISSIEPDNTVLSFNLGVARYRAGDAAGARQAWEHTVAVDPTVGDAWLYLGLQEQESGRYVEALRRYREGLEHDSENMRLWVSVVDCQRKSGDLDGAVVSAKEALGINGNSVAIFNNLGLTYQDKGDLDMAMFVFSKALSQIPGAEKDAHLHTNLGWLLYLRGKKPNAMFHLQRAVELDPNLVPADVYLARLYLEDRNYGDMVPLLQRARDLDPENHDVLMNLGIAYRGVASRSYSKARADLEEAEESQRERLKAEAKAAYESGLGEAEAAYQAALEIDPENPDPLFNLAILYGDYRKDYDRAIAAFEQYVELGGGKGELAEEYIEELKTERKRAQRREERERKRMEREAQRERDRLEAERQSAAEEEEAQRRAEEEAQNPPDPVDAEGTDGAERGGGEPTGSDEPADEGPSPWGDAPEGSDAPAAEPAEAPADEPAEASAPVEPEPPVEHSAADGDSPWGTQ